MEINSNIFRLSTPVFRFYWDKQFDVEVSYNYDYFELYDIYLNPVYPNNVTDFYEITDTSHDDNIKLSTMSFRCVEKGGKVTGSVIVEVRPNGKIPGNIDLPKMKITAIPLRQQSIR